MTSRAAPAGKTVAYTVVSATERRITGPEKSCRCRSGCGTACPCIDDNSAHFISALLVCCQKGRPPVRFAMPAGGCMAHVYGKSSLLSESQDSGGDDSHLHALFECGPACMCPPACANRVGQQGLKYRLELFKHKRCACTMSTCFLALQTRMSPAADEAKDALASCRVWICTHAVLCMQIRDAMLAGRAGLQELPSASSRAALCACMLGSC